jgi:hypothetical protein
MCVYVYVCVCMCVLKAKVLKIVLLDSWFESLKWSKAGGNRRVYKQLTFVLLMSEYIIMLRCLLEEFYMSCLSFLYFAIIGLS